MCVEAALALVDLPKAQKVGGVSLDSKNDMLYMISMCIYIYILYI